CGGRCLGHGHAAADWAKPSAIQNYHRRQGKWGSLSRTRRGHSCARRAFWADAGPCALLSLWPLALEPNVEGGAMKVVEITEPNAPFSLVERPIPDPQSGEARIRVEACGICHSDMYPKTG